MYRIEAPTEALSALVEGGTEGEVSETLKAYLMQTMLGALPNQINGLAGASDPAAAAYAQPDKPLCKQGWGRILYTCTP